VSAIERVRRRDPRVPVSPQLALRVGILGAIAMLMFGVIFFRLWYLQVLTGEQNVQRAETNQVRDLPIAAPRGDILGREGSPIVTSVTANAVQIVPSELPPGIAPQAVLYKKRLDVAENARLKVDVQLTAYEESLRRLRRVSARQHAELESLRRAGAPARVAVPPLAPGAHALAGVFRRLGAVIKLSARSIDERVVRAMTVTPYAHVTVKTDAGAGPLTVLGERANEFPGVVQEQVSTRAYPFGELAAQMLGHVGLINEEELGQKAFRGVKAGTEVGQEGLEFYYDRYLRGIPGTQRVEVNAEGQPVPSRQPETAPVAGHILKTTISLPLQRESEKALREGIEHARAGGKPATGGAFLAMNPRNGEVLSIGSWPSFDPNRFSKSLTPAEYGELIGSGSVAGPLTDRAVEGAYPTGSTFKPITAMAALENGVITPGEGLGAGSCITVATEEFCNAGHTDYGAVGLVEALKVSSDTYFFEVGERAYYHGEVIQHEAERLGIGHPTGIDLPSELEGTVPGPAWRAKQNRLQEECEARHEKTCAIVEEIGPWRVGDNMHLAVGQGELLTDPLQMAVAYSALADAYTHGGEGTIVTPHLGLEIDEPTGGLRQKLSFPSHPIHLDYQDLALVMQGIHEAASAPQGTSADVWTGWNQQQDPVYGKTGTAERAGQVEQSWYMCYIGDPSHPIVIAVTVEQGGFGAETAAPIARLIASQFYHQPLKFVAGSSKTF
jgi:penicillin-binding protein 2